MLARDANVIKNVVVQVGRSTKQKNKKDTQKLYVYTL